MIRRLASVAILGLIGVGCDGTDTSDGVGELPEGATSAVAPPQPISAPGAGGDRVPVESGAVVLTPANTQISFVGSKPDGSSHVGGFRDFSGEIEVDPETDEPRSISVTIRTDSIYSDNERLTGHLKTPDFFNVREYPEAVFRSTAIEPGEDGYRVTGDLTLLDSTNSITFPAKIEVADDGLSLASAFTIDRLAFGMDYQPDGINKDVGLTVAVGAAAARQVNAASASDARSPGGGNRGDFGDTGRRTFDPEVLFAQRDADGDGTLTGEEISDRMRERLDQIDADGDGSVSLEEFQASMERFRRGRGAGGPATAAAPTNDDDGPAAEPGDAADDPSPDGAES